ncbi:syntaxin-binding protein 5-like [Centruroides sculpturatus]|uniref:syntaxin-binding protein 5-like n=1 Tax=Centruroides sculpturatus TaxID=218467 RepID=UPI000C6E15E2|nr:syntaxin-binding protein 5-like [Centruroides sculpturatus]
MQAQSTCEEVTNKCTARHLCCLVMHSYRISWNLGKNRASPTTSSSEIRDSQFIVMTSEKEARVLAVPSQTYLYKSNLTETSFVVRAEVISIKGTGNVCLAAYIGNGNIVVYSLPSLKLLHEVDFLPLVDTRYLFKTNNELNNIIYINKYIFKNTVEPCLTSIIRSRILLICKTLI